MKTLLLDIGGVLYLGEKADEAFWAKWAGPCAMPADELAERFWHGADIERANVGTISAEAYFERSSSRLGVPADLVSAMVREVFGGKINRELIAFVQEMRAAGAPVSALTNSWHSESQIMARPEFAGLFDQVISSADVGAAKPGEAIYRIAMERLGVAPHDIVFVDDTAANVATARALAWHAIQFVETGQAISEIKRDLVHRCEALQ